ncbi:unnamed protein product [Amoebophrya sp. A25]|nr:unnamed protein product [Amoebophrya sp. A25]|eukprot:GSA25T00005744001.1
MSNSMSITVSRRVSMIGANRAANLIYGGAAPSVAVGKHASVPEEDLQPDESARVATVIKQSNEAAVGENNETASTSATADSASKANTSIASGSHSVGVDQKIESQEGLGSLRSTMTVHSINLNQEQLFSHGDIEFVSELCQGPMTLGIHVSSLARKLERRELQNSAIL